MSAKSALTQIIEKEVSGSFDVVESEGSVSTTLTKIAPHNFERLAMTIVNLGAANCYVSPSENVSATHGIKLNANGGSLTLTARDDLTMVGHEWYAIAEGANNAAYITQVVRYN